MGHATTNVRYRVALLRHRLRKIPPRTRMGALIAVVAITGLIWQHNAAEDSSSPASDPPIAQEQPDHAIHNHDGHALGEYQPDPSELPPPPDFSPETARVTAQRFASNFAAPNGNHEDWLARLSPDVMPELLDQYRLTDIRNVPQTDVVEVSGPTTSDPAAPTFLVAFNDGSNVETTLEMTIDGWKVSIVVPVDAPSAPSAPPAEPAAPTPAPTSSTAVPGTIPIAVTHP